MAELKRQLGLLDATMINVGTIIASAIFIVPSAIALQLHASLPTILVWIAGGLVSLLGALSVAELGAAMPKAGGQYVYLTEAYGPVWGYLYGWASGVVINPASIAAIAVGFATYFGFFVPLADAGIKAVAVASIVALTALNCLGVRLGAITQNVLTLIKMALLGVLIVAGFVLPGGSVANLSPLWPPAGGWIAPFGVAMVAALWAYDGWIEITYVGSEVKDPERNLPRSIVLTWISTEPSWKDTYSRLFTYVVLSEFVFYAMSCGAVLRLRHKAPDLVRPYKTWGYPVTPIVFILFSLWLVINTAWQQPRDAVAGAALILAGLPIYFLRRGAVAR